MGNPTRVRLIRRPGQHGTKAYVAQYGDRLVCVRYRYDAAAGRRYKTVEIIVEETSWEPADRRPRSRARAALPADTDRPEHLDPPAEAELLDPPAEADRPEHTEGPGGTQEGPAVDSSQQSDSSYATPSVPRLDHSDVGPPAAAAPATETRETSVAVHARGAEGQPTLFASGTAYSGRGQGSSSEERRATFAHTGHSYAPETLVGLRLPADQKRLEQVILMAGGLHRSILDVWVLPYEQAIALKLDRYIVGAVRDLAAAWNIQAGGSAFSG